MHFPFDSDLGPPISERPIFAVDDSQAERASFVEALRESGVKNPCRFFPNGDKMIDALFSVLRGAPPPLLCFLDLKSPGMCGLDVLRWIRMQDRLAGMSVVILTSTEDAATLKNVLRHGAQCCVEKFPSAAQLRQILAEAQKFSLAACGPAAFDVSCTQLRAAS